MPPIEDWFNRRVTPIKPLRDLADFAGYNISRLRCPSCEHEFRSIYADDPSKLTCPECKSVGIQLVKFLKHIYLH